ncbi:hypothetical protein B6U91_00315 [Candidatus Pacearchaeota archaeon ex4484_71]|nr:MAG: hypothetical protein B6U91_00315 [Candidatus Pacearchaeota archaeon ex4484_71]
MGISSKLLEILGFADILERTYIPLPKINRTIEKGNPKLYNEKLPQKEYCFSKEHQYEKTIPRDGK